MEFNLNGTSIEQPAGMNGLYLTEVRSDRYFGIVRRKTAMVKGIGQVKFIEKKAVEIITSQFEKDSINANVNFQVKDDTGNEFYSGYIDYSTQTRLNDGITVSFRDNEPINAFDVNIDTEYSIPLTEKITLKKQNIFGTLSHEIDSSLAVVFSKIDFSIPFKAKNIESVGEGLAMSVSNVFSESPVYINNTTQPKNINVTGKLVFDVQSTAASTLEVSMEVLSDTGSVVKDLDMVRFSATTTLTTKNIIFKQAITLQPNESIAIMVHSVTGECSFNFNSASFLSIEEDIYEVESECYSMSVFDLMSKLTTLASVGKLTFESDVERLKTLYITNGYNIRGVNSNLIVSFGKLYDDIKKILCLSCNSIGDKIKVSYTKDLSKGYIQEITRNSIVNMSYPFANNYVYNTVKAGYSVWQSSTQLGNEEINANATYTSEFNNIKNSIDLVCKNIIASSKLIEYTRRLQFKQDKSSSKTDNQYDNSLFIVDIESSQNETLSPYNIIKNWEFFLGYSPKYTYLSSEGGYTLQDNYQAITFSNCGITGELVTVETSKDFASYDRIYNVFSYREGTTIKKALLLSKEYRLTQNTFLTGIVLNQ